MPDRPKPPPKPPVPPLPSIGKHQENTNSIRLAIRGWWHDILRKYGKFSCYATFLVLTSNKEALRYLDGFGKELLLLAGDNCLILAFSKSLEMNNGFDKVLWKAIVSEHVEEGHSIKFAKYFNIDVAEFPCLMIFDEIRSPNHIVVSLKGMTAEEIAERMQIVFSVINKSISGKTNPLQEMRNRQIKEGLNQKGKLIFGEMRTFTGKTIETAVEALINANIK